MILEKINTYLKRKKIRDLYDIFFLLNYVKRNRDIEKQLKNLIKNFEAPVDEENLNEVIISGAVPNSKQLLYEITRWVK